MEPVEKDFYGGGHYVLPAPKPFVFPAAGPQPTHQVTAFWRSRLRPHYNDGCHAVPDTPYYLAIQDSDDYYTCSIRPLAPKDAMVSHVLLHGGGTYEWTPLPSPKGVKFPYLRITLGDYTRTDVSVTDVDPALPFTITQIPTQYTIEQGDRVWFILRHLISRRRRAPLTLSFADVEWTVRLSTNENEDEDE